MRKYTLLAICLWLSALTGCGTVDPWRTHKFVPSSNEKSYEAPRQDVTAIKVEDESDVNVSGRLWTLAECIRIALERNSETRRSWHAAQSAAAHVGELSSAFLPSATVSAGVGRENPVKLDRDSDPGSYDVYEAGFGVRYLLFDGGGRASRVRGAEAELRKASFQHNTTLQDVALGVEEAYYQLLAAKQIVRVAEETARQTQYHVDIARARHEAGIVTKADVFRAETERADADLLLVQAKSAVRVARGQLATAMGLKVSRSIEVEDLPDDSSDRELADIDRLLTEAADLRPELQIALAELESRRANVDDATSRYWPEVQADAVYSLRDRTFVPEREEWSFGLSATLPLFEGFRRNYEVRRAKAELEQAMAAYETRLRDVELEVWIAYARLLEARQAIEAAESLVVSAQAAARLSEGEYKNGTGSMLELIDSQTALSRADVRLVQARLDWYMAIARIERAVGRVLAKHK